MEIKKIVKTTFECSDGSIFEDIKTAEKYVELYNALSDVANTYLYNNKTEGKNYIQQTSENVDKFIYNVCVLAAAYLPSHSDYFNRFYNREINMGQLWNSLSNIHDVKAINKALYRISCISNITYKEYNEPYLTKNDAHNVYIRGNKDNGNKIIEYLESLGGDNYHELDGIDCDNYYLIDGHGIIVVESFPCLIPSSYHEIELPKYF